ncbi:DMT family transporter [Ensifer sp.]|uniref:DMT family transporter n=1 Tax=Ensifer sp. TaxID=1872086 RepID=UPI000DD92E79|nr:DMT family transporter [Ensifer sp.]
MTTPSAHRLNPLHLMAAFGTGGLLTLMVHFNGELGRYGNALFSSWAAHGTGTVAALVLLAILYPWRSRSEGAKPRAPLWSYLGGISGAVTVMLTSFTVNSPLALSGTLALGLAGQVIFSIVADRWGLFGLPMRRPDRRDLAAMTLILAGSALIILFGRGEA